MTAVLSFPVASLRDDLPVSLLLELSVRDPETIAELCAFAEGEPRDEFARQALRIGVLALRQARGNLDSDVVRNEGERLLAALQGRLDDHAKVVHERTTTTLREYFDPQSGRFEERVNRLIGRDGELEQVLRRQLGAEDSELTKTLAAHIGEDSPLLQFLSPDETRGLLAALRGALDEQLQQQREHVLKQFSLDNKDGALSRFILELSERQGVLAGQLQDRIDCVVKEFSLDEENSALSRLVANVDRAQRTITREFSLDDDASALARMRRELLNVFKQHREENQKFQEEVKLALQAMAVRKEEAARSTRHGLDFEAAVVELVQQEAQKTGDVAEATGARVGSIKNCKKGDVVVELGPESVAPGARVVVEAKEESGYQMKDARAEIEQARNNRGASVGLFIFSRRTASSATEPLLRIGDDVYVVWDPEDTDTDLYVRLGLSVARALAVRHHQHDATQTADFQELESAILHIEKATNGLDELQTSAEQVGKHSEKMLGRIGLVRKELLRQIEVLRDKTAALKSQA
jgi:hypothetical protein